MVLMTCATAMAVTAIPCIDDREHNVTVVLSVTVEVFFPRGGNTALSEGPTREAKRPTRHRIVYGDN